MSNPESKAKMRVAFSHEDGVTTHIRNGNFPIFSCTLKKNEFTDEKQKEIQNFAEQLVKASNRYEKLINELKKELTWLKHIEPQVQAPSSVMTGFKQAIKSIEATLKEVSGE